MIFMKRILVIFILSILSACEQRSSMTTLPDPVPDQSRTSSVENVSLYLPQTTFNESPAEIEAIVYNDSPREFTIGDFYHIEIKKEGVWYILSYSDKVFFENRRFKDYGRTLYPNREIHQTFSVEALGITLTPGEYRLVKSFSPKEGTFYKISVAVPFSVE